jgi:hypothetical protein
MRFATCSTPTSSCGTPRVGRSQGPHVGREAVLRQFQEARELWDSDVLEATADFQSRGLR